MTSAGTETHIRQHDPEAVGPFEAAMAANGWQPRRDVFGKIIEWIYPRTGKTVGHNLALDWYWLSGDTPAKLV